MLNSYQKYAYDLPLLEHNVFLVIHHKLYQLPQLPLFQVFPRLIQNTARNIQPIIFF